MAQAFQELANGNFLTGLEMLDSYSEWHDGRNDLEGPFRLGFPGARGWGEDLLVASLLKRAANGKTKTKVFTDWQVCSILKQDPALDPVQSKDDKQGRSPLAILRGALTGGLLEREFSPIGGTAEVKGRNERRTRIGITWASVTNGHPILAKSVPAEEFLDIFGETDADLVSLQRNLEVADPGGFLRKHERVEVIPGDVLEAKDQESLQKLLHEIRELDSLVTISTTTAHIAASMGIRVELIVAERKGHQWFWQVQANHGKCFYPTVQVYLGNGEDKGWWQKSLNSVKTSLRR